MKTLIAFGDSHVSGAEIEYKNQGLCYEKAFSAKIAEHFNLNYENYGQPGGSTDYVLLKLMHRVKQAIKNKEEIFLIIGICDPTRTHYRFRDKDFHFTTAANTEGWPTIVCRAYADFIALHSDDYLSNKILNQVLLIQSFLKSYKIPYVMFSTTHFTFGDWSLIDPNRYYGHHIMKNSYYNNKEAMVIQKGYSYWGVCSYHPEWLHYRKESRWSGHYPEEFHTFWAKTMIDYIENYNLLSFDN